MKNQHHLIYYMKGHFASLCGLTLYLSVWRWDIKDDFFFIIQSAQHFKHLRQFAVIKFVKCQHIKNECRLWHSGTAQVSKSLIAGEQKKEVHIFNLTFFQFHRIITQYNDSALLFNHHLSWNKTRQAIIMGVWSNRFMSRGTQCFRKCKDLFQKSAQQQIHSLTFTFYIMC